MMNDTLNKLTEASNGSDISGFIDNYRNALEEQKTADEKALAAQREIGHTGIMSAANRSGLLHSSFPTINKLKYDTNTYEPALVKQQQSYQTGLDTLYSNVSKYFNNIKNIRDKIADLNEVQ